MTEDETVWAHGYCAGIRHTAEDGFRKSGPGAVVADMRGPDTRVKIYYQTIDQLPLPRWQRRVTECDHGRELVLITLTDTSVKVESLIPTPKVEA